MRETRTSGSGRGDQGNPVPYRHRVSPVAAHPGEGRLTPATAAAQARRPEPLFMPLFSHCRDNRLGPQVGGKEAFPICPACDAHA